MSYIQYSIRIRFDVIARLESDKNAGGPNPAITIRTYYYTYALAVNFGNIIQLNVEQ